MNEEIPSTKPQKKTLHVLSEKKPLLTLRDPKTKLATALDILEKYHASSGASKLLNGLRKTKTSQAKEIVRFAFQWVTSHFSSEARCHQELLEKTLQNALDEVKRYHPVVCSAPSKESQKLIERALSAIQKYNQLIDAAKSSGSRWDKRLLRFFINKNAPSLKRKNRIVLQTAPSSKQLRFLSSFPRMLHGEKTGEPLLKQEEDAFRMKAISLIQKHKIAFPSIEETLKAIQQSPIISQKETASVIALEQTMYPFPGEILILKGAFKRQLGSLVSSTPIPERFELSLESSQTGFPCPSQWGWSLSDEWIPPEPHHPEAISLLCELLQRKKQIIQKIKNSTIMKQRAYQLFVTKKETAEKHRKTFLTLHKQLWLALLTAAPASEISKEAVHQISPFFSWLETHPHLYLELVSTYQLLNRICFSLPFKALHQSWLEQADAELFSDNKEICLKAAKKILKKGWKNGQERLEENLESEGEKKEIKKRFLLSIIPVLTAPSQEVFLHYFSETIDFCPSPLSIFAKKLQSLAFFQQEGFFKALEKEQSGTEDSFKSMEENLFFAALHFQHNHPVFHHLVERLEKYYTRE